MPRRHASPPDSSRSSGLADPPAASVSSATNRKATALPSHIKKRLPRTSRADADGEKSAAMDDNVHEDSRPLRDGASTPAGAAPVVSWARRNQWIVFALASGACAAFNGVFAKLTTTELTSTFSQAIARLLHLSDIEGGIEVAVRSMFFGLNLVFNGVMWTLFTTALARGNSTTQVSIMNTSSNFVITAVLGFAIFSEALPPMWWLGAALLVAGNVIIGSKDEGSTSGSDDGGEVPSATTLAEAGLGAYEPIVQLDGQALSEDANKEDEDEDQDVLDLDLEE
ncbi:hypothetical protein B0T22DRAFT_439918 [Podospora appendiculata]|uniref:Transmembrane protein 42 n=1 Tax=Podospora appendiculata TaxID=314037 RepID=A0AAE1CCC7_9PEZI|nr:hypothetical protein B0T22DRAFT_439918 [Podospora appendiculata]